MKTYKTDLLDLRCCDCMEMMAEYPDNYFQLAIVDVPYGIGENGSTNHTRGKLAVAKNYKSFHGGDMSAPVKDYWEELFRVSKNQIVWGANHFISRIAIDSSCWIVWDKLNGESDFADCELAWTSFKTAVRRFSFRWAGMLQGNMAEKEIRIHPTQKPRALYDFILHNYAKPGDRILDTHLGSASSAIACHYKGFHLTGAELDEDYFDAAIARVKRETAQQELAL